MEKHHGKNTSEKLVIERIRPIEGRFCKLVEMEEKYLPALTRYLNDPEINRYLRIRPPVTVEQQREWLESCKKSGKDKVFAILLKNPDQKKDSEFIGVVGLHEIDMINKTARGGAIVGNKEHQGKGIGKEARLLQLKYAFDALGLRWVWGSAIGFNIRSQRLMEATGYKKLGIRPKSRFAEEAFHDEILYGVNRDTWEPFWKKYKEGR